MQFFLRCSQDGWPRCDEEARLNWSPSVSLADENPHRDEEGVVSDVGKCIVFLAAEGRSVTWERCSPAICAGEISFCWSAATLCSFNF